MEKYWYQKQIRALQTVLRETDIIDYDADGVVNYMKKSGANVLVVNAGGICNFFHSDLEIACENQFMKEDQEILRDLCDTLHAEGFHIITRIDFRGAQQYRYDAHPDWFALNADGSPKVNMWGLHAPCYIGEYANAYAVRFLNKLMNAFPLDGIWENSIAFAQGACYCRACRETYRRELGKEIPVGDFASPLFDEYRRWKAGKAEEHILRIRDTVKSFGQDKAYAAEVFGMYHTGISFMTGIDTYLAKHFDFIVGVGFLSGGTSGNAFDDLTYPASAVRFLKSIDDEKPTVILTGNNGTRWRYIKDPSLESRIWMWQTAAAGGNLWNCMFNGQHPDKTVDRRNAYLEKDIYGYLKDNQEIIQEQTLVKDVAVYFSKTSRDKFGNENEKVDEYGVCIKGIEAVLTDNHIPYGFVNDMNLCTKILENVKVLVLPNAACLSDEYISVIREYVKNGGSIMASYETSLYDENSVKRHDFGLADVFGVSYTGIKKDTSIDCYQMIRERGHQILEGMETERTEYLMNGSSTLLTTPTSGDGVTVCSYIPLIPNQWPEQAWIKITKTEFPTIYARTYGKGRVVYFANRMDALAYTNGHEDYFNILNNALKFLAGSCWSMTTNVPDSVNASLLRGRKDSDSYLLSFVNLTSSGRRTIRSLYPVGAFSAAIRLEEGKKLVSARTLWGKEAAVRQEGEQVIINVPDIEEFFSVYVKIE